MTNILLLSYFDPYWLLDPPRWALPKKSYKAIEEQIAATTRNTICNMVHALSSESYKETPESSDGQEDDAG